MTRQNISVGTIANDGTGDTLRSAGNKINDNFVELYQAFGTDSGTLGSGITFDSNSIVFAGIGTTTITRLEPNSPITLTVSDITGTSIVIDGNNIVDLIDSATSTSPAKIHFSNSYDSAGLFPNATTYDGMFAHASNTSRAFFSNNGAWQKLMDSDTFTSRTNLQIITPRMDTTVYDNTGTFGILELDNTSTGNTSYVKIANTNDSAPTITTDGASTDIGIKIKPKNAGAIQLDGGLVYSSEFYDQNSDSDLDSNASFYIISTNVARSYKLHDGRYGGETKRFIVRSTADTTIETNAGNILRPDANYTNFTVSDTSFITLAWTDFGTAWVVDRDSDRYITYS